MKTQDLVLEQFKKIADDAKLTVSIEENFSNTGNAYFRKGFKTVGSVHFDFQTKYATFTCHRGEPSTGYFGMEDDRKFYIKYETSSDFEKLFTYMKHGFTILTKRSVSPR